VKRFSFRLDRVLAWRQSQARLQEARLEHLYGELHAISARETALRQESERAHTALVASGRISGADLAAWASYCAAGAAQLAKVQEARVACKRSIAAQMEEVATRRREARLLEKMRQRRLSEWNTALAREETQQAGEIFLTRWNGIRGPQ
jgi:flagellar export protein FliJ